MIWCKNSIVCLKRPKINEKEAWDGPFVKKIVKWGSLILDPIKIMLEHHFAHSAKRISLCTSRESKSDSKRSLK